MSEEESQVERYRRRKRDNARRLRHERIAKGLCQFCGMPADSGMKSCMDCRAKRREADRKRPDRQKAARARRVKDGLCIYCGTAPPRKKYQSCLECAVSVGKKLRKWRQKLRDNFTCLYCGKAPASKNYNSCAPCRRKNRKDGRRRTAKRKRDGLCIRCSDPLPEGHATVSCAACMQEAREKQAEYRVLGLCMRCLMPLEKGATISRCKDCKAKEDKIKRRTRARRIKANEERGICITCNSEQADGGGRQCAACRKVTNDRVREAKDVAIEFGFCWRCKADVKWPDGFAGTPRCDACREKDNKSARHRYGAKRLREAGKYTSRV